MPISLASALADAAEAATPPNIVIILVDEMGFSDIGCYRAEIETPHIRAQVRRRRTTLRFASANLNPPHDLGALTKHTDFR